MKPPAGRPGFAGRIARSFVHSKLTPLVLVTSVLAGAFALARLPREEEPQIIVPMGIGCLPVLDGDKPVGIVTTTDLLDFIGRGSERPIERSTRWTLRARGARRASASARHARRG